MRIKTKANVVISVDTDGKDRLFGLDDVRSEVTLDGFTEVSSGNVELETNDELEIPFSSITDARGVFLKASGNFNLQINDSVESIVVRRGLATGAPTDAASAKVFLEAALTYVKVTALEDLTLSYALWGL